MNVPAKFEACSLALPVSEIIAIEVLDGGCEPPILGRTWSGMVPFERALVGSYRPP